MSDDLGAAGLRFERDGGIGWCVIDRPQARNALTPAMYSVSNGRCNWSIRIPDWRR